MPVCYLKQNDINKVLLVALLALLAQCPKNVCKFFLVSVLCHNFVLATSNEIRVVFSVSSANFSALYLKVLFLLREDTTQVARNFKGFHRRATCERN